MTANEPASPPVPTTIDPTAPGERLEVIDIVRGVAILGILFVNIQAFSFPEGQTGFNEEAFPGMFDSAARWTVAALIEGKFYTMFSILFGLGVAVQSSRALARGRWFAPFYCRRLLALLFIALIHDIFLWNGRILIAYALLGFLLIPFWKRSRKTLLIWIASLLILCILTPAIAGLTFRAIASQRQEQRQEQGQEQSLEPQPVAEREGPTIEERQARREQRMRQAFDEELELFQSDRYMDMVRYRLGFLSRTLGAILFFLLYMLGIFLAGIWIWKAEIFQRTEEKLPLIRRIAFWGLILGVVGTLGFLWPRAMDDPLAMTNQVVSMTGFYIGSPALCLFYLMGIILLARRPFWRRLMAPFAAAGRTALSNYLFQAVVCTTLFYGYGFGLFGKVGPAMLLLIQLPIFAVQLGLSNWWVRRFRFGPAEWVWRSLTYMRVQRMR